jgi:hypothetical protein
MRMKQGIIAFILIFLTMTAFAISSDTKDPAAYLVYFDDDYEVEVFGPDGDKFDYVDWNMELPEGSTVKTYNSTAELELVPNGSIIKLDFNTEFMIEALQRDQESANSFALFGGKIRTVAARSGFGENYSIRTPSAVCGVRGTDFGMQVIRGASDAVAVLRGSVEFINIQTGQNISVAAGQAADVFADVFRPFTLDTTQIRELFDEMSFRLADPASVPGNEAAAGDTTGDAGGDTAGDTEGELEDDTTERLGDTSDSAPSVPEPGTETSEADETAGMGGENFLQPVYDFLGRFLGMELGTTSIDGKTYAKAVFLPKFEIGKFRMALYLPIIYNTDLFDPQDWYKPAGNNEWSFGTDQTGALPIVKDVLHDVTLKIKYIEYGDNRDPFFFKLGNIESITLGHGILMRNFPADIGFPAVRHLGVNAGLDFKIAGFEGVIADVGVPEIFGGRLYFRPLHKTFPFAIGVSSIIDTYPAGQVVPDAAGNVETYGNPLFLTAALDLDFPIIETDPFAIVLFGDGGILLPYYRENYSDYITPGFRGDALYSADGSFSLRNFNNFGFSSGVLGNVFFIDYRADFRYYKGIFKPMFFSTDYHRRRGSYVRQFSAFFSDPAADGFRQATMGVYGELGASIGKILKIRGGYFWPWQITDTGVNTTEDDLFHLEIVLMPNVIPVVGIHGSLSFDRTKFIPTITGNSAENLELFDAYTTISAELAVPIGPFLELAVTYTTNTAYAADGTLAENSENPLIPKVNPSISIETRINF